MKKTNHIKKFLFGFAQYYLSDEYDNRVLLKINYKNNSYAVKGTGISEEFRQEVEDVALKLLKRKHGVNRAKYVYK